MDQLVAAVVRWERDIERSEIGRATVRREVVAKSGQGLLRAMRKLTARAGPPPGGLPLPPPVGPHSPPSLFFSRVESSGLPTARGCGRS